MRKVTLFIAMSLDGYIADENSKVDWLQGQKAAEDDMVSYQEFIQDVDTVIMGWNTYHQITTELSPGVWMYPNQTSYVLTHRNMPPAESIRFVQKDAGVLVRQLKTESGKDIWICGGPSVINPLLRENLIDRFHISVIPTLLGNGIPLFESGGTEKKLRLVKTGNYNGIVDVVYELREDSQHRTAGC